MSMVTVIEYRPAASASTPPAVSTREAAAQVEGPWRFDLVRSGRAVASGVLFPDDAVVLRWRGEHRSTAVYASMRDFVAVHVDGHEGTVVRWTDPEPSEAFLRGVNDCVQDSCENCPFGSVGGLESRTAPHVPSYIDAASEAEWLRGYLRVAQSMYGDDWQTCSFGWSPAMTIGGASA